jgi:hypothetical protein
MTSPKRPTPSAGALTRFARILLTLGSGESPWLIVAFVLGVTALGVFANFVYGGVAAPESLTWAGALRVLSAVVVLVGLAYAAYRYDLRLAWQSQRFAIDEKRLAPRHPGLIWLLSPGGLELPQFAIRHHLTAQGGEPLRHCWLLISPGAQEAFERLSGRVAELGYAVDLHPVRVTAGTIEAAYRAVDQIYTTEAGAAQLRPEQIVADLTGGLKPMTAGMVLACLPHGHALEYIESDRDDAGRPIDGTQRAILVGVDFGHA